MAIDSNTLTKQSPPTPLRLALRPKEAAAALGIGERLLWELSNRGELPHVKLGRCVVYPVADLERWLSERAAEGRP